MRLRARGLGFEKAQAARVDLPLLKATARPYRWSNDLLEGRARSIGEIAKRERLTGRHVRRVMRLAFLAPKIVKAIAEGRHLRTSPLSQ